MSKSGHPDERSGKLPKLERPLKLAFVLTRKSKMNAHLSNNESSRNEPDLMCKKGNSR